MGKKDKGEAIHVSMIQIDSHINDSKSMYSNNEFIELDLKIIIIF